ncbi:MAG TPA: hypothetical protein VFZ66_11265 [Herpetosiphonaceae bacterium]
MPRDRRATMRRASLLMALLTLLAACGQTQPPASEAGGPVALPLSGAVAEAPGKLLFDSTGTWTTLELSSQQRKEIASFAERVVPSTPAVAPDGQTVAFSVFTFGKGPDDPAYGTDLYLMQADGSEQQTLLAHAAPAETLTQPAWSADGKTLYFTFRKPSGEQQIERMSRDGSERSAVVKQGESPTLSADGQHLVYIGPDPKHNVPVLLIAGADGSNPRPLLHDWAFQAIAAPRFAPRGNQIVFAAVPNPTPSPTGAQPQREDSLLDGLRPRTARAHGIPWDLWIVNADGSGLQQLTKLAEDSPMPAWSPDGAWIGFKGEMGLYIVDLAGKQVRRVAEDKAVSIAWLP